MRTTEQAPIIARAAEVLPTAIDKDARQIEVVWTTGATVQRGRWEGWDDYVEYDEELVVSGNAVRLDRLNAGGPFLDSHMGYSLSNVLGSVVPGSVRIEGGNGVATIQLTEAADAADAVSRILDKSVRFVSVGYRVHRYEIEKQDGKRELWRAVDWEPYEISAVPMPADAGAHIRSSAGMETRTFPCIVTRDGASTPTGDNPMADENAAGAEPGDQVEKTEETTTTETTVTTTTTAAPTADDQHRGVAAERQRTAEIVALCQRHGMADRAPGFISAGASLDAVRSELLDALATRSDGYGRRQEPSPAAARRDDARGMQFRDAATAAVMHRIKPSIELPPEARELRGMGMVDLARECLRRAGVEERGMYGHEVISAALNVRAGVGYHTTSDFAVIVSNVANKTLRDAYEATPRTFTQWARRTTLKDFRPVTRGNLWAAPDLLIVPEAAEFKYGTLGAGGETLTLSTYGRIIAFTRQLLINDDMDALSRIPNAFGASAADLESDIVYGILMANPVMSDGVALFHATHGNLGTAAQITDASLAAAMQAFATRKGPEARPISIRPRYIIVPPGPREIEARRVLAQTTPNNAAGVNVYAGALEIIVEPRLIPAAGQHPWFLAADPARVDTIDYAFLEGQEGVYTETRAGFEVDGVEHKARHDFGAGAMDWRGLYKNPGAAPA